MKPPLAVIDTNVVISGLLSADPDLPVCRTLDGMLQGRFPYLLSTEFLAEYRRVLLRPKLRALYGLDNAAVDVLLEEIVANAILREPREAVGGAPPDSGDAHLWRLMAVQSGAVLVTGDKELIERPPSFGSVLSPRGFSALMP